MKAVDISTCKVWRKGKKVQGRPEKLSKFLLRWRAELRHLGKPGDMAGAEDSRMKTTGNTVKTAQVNAIK